MRRPLLVLASLLVSTAFAAPLVYDESVDAKAEIRAALAAAQRDNVPLLVIFGANWCGDCKVLDGSLKSPGTAPLIAKNFKVVKVNVGRFDANVDIADGYNVPLKKGIPAIAILASDGTVRYATKAGELADARKMGHAAIYDFFKAAASAPTRTQ